MRPIDAKKLTEDLAREDWPFPFATDADSAPGWVTNGHFAVYVGDEAAKSFPGKVPYTRFRSDKRSLGELLDGMRSELASAVQLTPDPRFYIPTTESDVGQCVYFRSGFRVCIQGHYGTLLDGLKVVHAGSETEPLMGLDSEGDLVAVVMPWDPGRQGLRVPSKKRSPQLRSPAPRKES